MTAEPDHIVLGISAESIWGGGLAAARAIRERVDRLTGGLPFTQAADALPAALRRARRQRAGRAGHAVLPGGARAPRRLPGRDRLRGRGRAPPRAALARSAIAHTPLATLREAIAEVNLPETRAIIQFGANLPMMRLAAQAEAWLGKPVIAINAATYWHALRSQRHRRPRRGLRPAAGGALMAATNEATPAPRSASRCRRPSGTRRTACARCAPASMST